MSPTSYQLLYPAILLCTGIGAGDRTRTGTVLLPGDFKSPVSTIPPHRRRLAMIRIPHFSGCVNPFFEKRKNKECRFVKHIGQRTQREKASGEASWESCWNGGYGQQAAFRSLQKNKNCGRNRNAFGPRGGCALPCHCVAGCKAG